MYFLATEALCCHSEGLFQVVLRIHLDCWARLGNHGNRIVRGEEEGSVCVCVCVNPHLSPTNEGKVHTRVTRLQGKLPPRVCVTQERLGGAWVWLVAWLHGQVQVLVRWVEQNRPRNMPCSISSRENTIPDML